MVALIGRRLILALITLILISLIVFLGVEALPGDTATAYLGQMATDESLESLREEFGLNDPLHERYLNWFGGILRGDLGESMVKRKPVVELIGNRFRNTVVLATAAALVGIPLAIVLGVIAGLMRDKWPDVFVSTTSIVGMTLPGFVTATILIYVFAIRLEWFPAITLVPSDVPVIELLPNIVLPIITLTLIMVAHILRLVRTNMIDVMVSDYVQMARLKGVPYWDIVFKHALPNAMLPTINVVALTLAWLLGGVAIIETVFNYPGIGKLMIAGITDRDFALVQGIAIILAAIYIALNLVADVLSMILNPKLRTARGH
ncbi:MAG: ABC transporter permease [Chloroflexota bacterium]|jgi:peptide/nickel transport system permease protein|nr:MAG: ABC transporter permease [Chloroflexota bacterium]UCF28603.1 MAG: ABC transporter permease [Chloroflexota bacterium]